MIWVPTKPRWGIHRAAAPTPQGRFILYCRLCWFIKIMHISQIAISRIIWLSYAYCQLWSYSTVKENFYSVIGDRVLPSPDRRSWGRASPRTAEPSRTTATRTTKEGTFTTRTTMTGLTSGQIQRAGAKVVSTTNHWSSNLLRCHNLPCIL